MKLTEHELGMLRGLGQGQVPGVVEQILEGRSADIRTLESERDQAVAMANSMQHFADVAEVCERKSNEYAAENVRLRTLLDAAPAGVAEEVVARRERHLPKFSDSTEPHALDAPSEVPHG